MRIGNKDLDLFLLNSFIIFLGPRKSITNFHFIEVKTVVLFFVLSDVGKDEEDSSSLWVQLSSIFS